MSEERVRGILQQPNNLQKKVNNGNKKKPDLTEIYPVFIQSEGEVDCLFIGKSCSKLGITLDTFLWPATVY